MVIDTESSVNNVVQSGFATHLIVGTFPDIHSLFDDCILLDELPTRGSSNCMVVKTGSPLSFGLRWSSICFSYQMNVSSWRYLQWVELTQCYLTFSLWQIALMIPIGLTG